MKVIFASHNAGKITEMRALLAGYALELVTQDTLHIPDIAETGLTFVENALLKARHASKLSQLPAIADDSGLVVPALQGAPGIYSARYAGEQGNNEANIKKLLHDMQHLKDHDRDAYFHCTLVFLRHALDPTPIICQGAWHGNVLSQPQGQHGFGYDPIFYVPSEQCSAAELPLVKKNLLSHRGKALQLLANALSMESS